MVVEKKHLEINKKPKNENPESEHEPKGKQCRPPNTQPSHNIVKKTNSKKHQKQKQNQTQNMTLTINNNDPEFWKEQNLGIIKDQLGKHNFKKHKNPDGSRMNKPHYLAEVHKMINEGSWIIKD